MFIGKYDKVYKVTTTINILTSWKQTFMLISAMQFGCHFTFCFDFNICFFLSTIALEWTFKKLKYFTHSAAVNFDANMLIMWTANYLTYKSIFKLGSCSSLLKYLNSNLKVSISIQKQKEQSWCYYHSATYHLQPKFFKAIRFLTLPPSSDTHMELHTFSSSLTLKDFLSFQS